MNKHVDYIIIGGGIYGLYAAMLLMKKNKKIVVMEYDDNVMERATLVNQARVHNGYHYPRSFSTAMKSVKYFNRFAEDFPFAINNKFTQIYAISKEYSYTSADQFKKFCRNCNIRCEEIMPGKYFKDGLVDGVFITDEYGLDSAKLREYFLEKLNSYKNFEIIYGVRIKSILNMGKTYKIDFANNDSYESENILNATYANINGIASKANLEGFKIKYEICEMILGKATENIKGVGLTVMDGPFFSIMPFGLTQYHSLTSVTFTPHITSRENMPTFPCQQGNVECSPICLGNCNHCINKPKSSKEYMYALMRKYLNNDIEFNYSHSMFSIKPILMESEIDDSRPTVIRKLNESPTFISVLSGKINTIYDLEGVI